MRFVGFFSRPARESRREAPRHHVILSEVEGSDIKLVVEPEVLDLIVDTSIENKLGARGLRSICEKIMTDAMYDAPTTGRKPSNLLSSTLKVNCS